MELKNIKNRKDFYVINEFFGGTKGGVGEKDGFANNAKLKDTYLGKLFDGIFSGINNLWKKSKEYFKINKLIAQLINEIFRGIIIFCFANDINLESGNKTDEGEIIGAEIDDETGEIVTDLEDDFEDDGNKEKNLEDDFEEELTIDKDEEITLTDDDIDHDNYSNLSKIELIEKIKRLTEGIREDSKKITDRMGQIKLDTQKIRANHYKVKEKNEKIEFINKLKKEVSILKKELEKSKIQLNRLKEALNKIKDSDDDGDDVSNFDLLKRICEEKYNFNPKAEYLPTEPDDFVDIGSMSIKEITKYLSKIKFNVEYIKINHEYTVVDDDGKLLNVQIWDVDVENNEVSYYHNGKLKTTKDVRLLPKYFPKIKEPMEICNNFLNKYISNYKNMGDEQKEKMETIYMQYKIIENISKIRRLSIIQETIDYADFVLESLVKVKPKNPKAGKVNVIRKGVISSGLSSVKVGDILTKKDKDKYKNKSESFDLSVKNINLADIENTIDNLEKTEPDIKTKVSTYVNPYNLRTISISAEQLMDGEDNNTLKLKWNKELSKAYAAFDDIMNVSNIDITNSSFGSKLTNKDIINKKSEKMTNEIKAQINNAKLMEKLPIDHYNSSSYSKMQNGDFTYYAFTYPGREKLYNTSLSPVSSVFKEFGLVCVTSSFEDYENNKIIEDPKFDLVFKSTKSDKVTNSNITNTYFLFKYEQRFPSKNVLRPTKIFVLNEHIINNDSYLSLKKIASGSKSISIDKNLVSNINKNEYIFNVNSVSIHKFVSNEVNNIASEFNLIRSDNIAKNTDFRLKQPSFLDDEMKEYLKKLSNML